jgi:Pentapeptide repeats (9 copies)
MAEESPVLLPPSEESIEAETDTALEPEPESGEPTPEPASEPSFVCGCKEGMRSACKGLPFYKAHESLRYCVLHYPGKEKVVAFNRTLERKLAENDFDFCGVWFPEPVDFRDVVFNAASFWSATFTSSASFGSATFNERTSFGYATFNADAFFSAAEFISEASFQGVRFGADAYFVRTSFTEEVCFEDARFEAEGDFRHSSFGETADFSYSQFGAGADFSEVEFSATVSFILATFNGWADFSNVTFCMWANFYSAKFGAELVFESAVFGGEVSFSEAVFDKPVNFSAINVADSISFSASERDRSRSDGTPIATRALGKDPDFDFQNSTIERPDKVSFHTAALRPNWFVNVDSRKVVFTDIDWALDTPNIKKEIHALVEKEISSPHRLLAIACRQLAENAEVNNRYEEASSFRYWAMDLARHYKWRGAVFWNTDWLHMLYWAVSGYGERILRALGVLAAVWFVFVLLYTRVGFVPQPPNASNEGAPLMTAPSMTIEDRIGQPLEFSRALTYSLAVMSLQKPEPKPLTGTAQTLVLLETILGPVQGALLALAIRRKFMR